MYIPELSYGDVDEPEMATTEILGTYETMDEACEAAKSKFDAIMERLGDDHDIHFCETETYPDIHLCAPGTYPDRYYVTYGYLNHKLGCVCQEYFYDINIFYE